MKKGQATAEMLVLFTLLMLVLITVAGAIKYQKTTVPDKEQLDLIENTQKTSLVLTYLTTSKPQTTITLQLGAGEYKTANNTLIATHDNHIATEPTGLRNMSLTLTGTTQLNKTKEGIVNG